MAIASTRAVVISFSGDVTVPQNTFAAAANAASPGEIEKRALTTGFNSITCPAGFKAVTIIPPAANIVTITLKGITGDTGIGLHLTDPTSIGLAAGQTTIGLTVSAGVTLQFIWT